MAKRLREKNESPHLMKVAINDTTQAAEIAAFHRARQYPRLEPKWLRSVVVVGVVVGVVVVGIVGIVGVVGVVGALLALLVWSAWSVWSVWSVLLLLLLVVVVVVVVVEWLYYSKRICFDEKADLTDCFVDFRRKNVCFCFTYNENCHFSSEKTITPQNGLLILIGKETHSETKSWKWLRILTKKVTTTTVNRGNRRGFCVSIQFSSFFHCSSFFVFVFFFSILPFFQFFSFNL